MTCPPRHKGYTLLELIVALAVLALMSLLIADALRLGLRTWDLTRERAARAVAVATAQQTLRGRLQQIYPYRVPHGSSAPPPLVGDADTVSFTAPGPHSMAGIMLRYRVFLERKGKAGALKIAWQPNSKPTTPQASTSPESEEAVLDDVDTASFQYFGRDAGGVGAWTSSWNKPEPPLLVRLHVRFVGHDQSDWPDLVVRPRITMPADCQFDLVTRRCR